tara:strand:- start:37 stop:537 length:501 start_codon:yes stop_codon:yes gene_type:complete
MNRLLSTFVIITASLVSSCDISENRITYPVPDSMIGTWSNQSGGVIRIFEGNTYSVSCSGIQTNTGEYEGPFPSSVTLINYNCLPEGILCNELAESVFSTFHSQHWGPEAQIDCETGHLADNDLRVNYEIGKCRREYCALMGSEGELEHSVFMKVSDDPDFEATSE